jgi:hypothetical protein
LVLDLFAQDYSHDKLQSHGNLALVASWIRLWTHSELSSMAFLLLCSESFNSLQELMGYCKISILTSIVTAGWANRKHHPSYSCIHSFICMSKILYKFRGTGYRLLSIISIKYMNISIIKRVKNNKLKN